MGGNLLASPDVRRLWLAGASANAMRWIEVLVTGVFAWEATGSAFVVSLVLVSRSVPMFLLGAVAGAVAEVLDRRRLLLGAYAVCGALAVLMAVLAALGALRVWHLALVIFVGGLAWTVDLAARRRMLAEAAGSADAVRAVALDTTTGATTRMVGPIAGGLLLQFLGLAPAFLLTAVFYAVAFVLVLGVRVPQARTTRRAAILAGVAEGARIAMAHRSLRVVILVTLAMNVFAFSYNAVLPAFGAEVFAVGAVGVGLLAAAEPAGALIGGVLLAMRRGAPLGAGWMLAGSVFFCLGLSLAALSPVYLLALLLIVIGGLGSALFGALQTGLVVTEAPPETRSRVLGLVTTCIGASPFGVLTVGALADAFGPALAIKIMATLALLSLALIWRFAWKPKAR
jgi:MFS family permease